MSILRRFIRLAKADAHGVLDSLEDRTLVIRQALRDAEQALEHRHAHHAELAARIAADERMLLRLAQRETTLDADIALAMQRDAEELARFSTRQWIAARKRRESLERELEDARREHAELTRKLAVQDRELEELRQQAEVEIAQQQALERDPALESLSGATVRDEEIELELLRRRATPTPRATVESRS